MKKTALTCASLLSVAISLPCAAQSLPPLDGQVDQRRVVVGTPSDASAEAISIPGVTTETFDINIAGQSKATSPTFVPGGDWLKARIANFGLGSDPLKPWHIVIAYDQFDDNGDNIHSGEIDEVFVGPKLYRRIYTGDSLHQTEYGTAKGLFRVGDQRFANRAELQARSEVVSPFAALESMHDLKIRETQETYGKFRLTCESPETQFGHFDVPRKFCFTPGTPVLRYQRGPTWYQTAYNGIVSFQGRHVATDVVVTDGGKPYLNLRLRVLEEATDKDLSLLVPPANATKVGDQEITGVQMRPTHTTFPEWPDSARGKSFTIEVEILVGKDGHVETAKAISGPEMYYKAAEKTAMKWIFQPYLVLGEPMKVRTKIGLSQD